MISCDLLYNYFLGFCVFFASIRLIKLFAFNKRIIVFIVAFRRSFNELASFGLIFVIMWLDFVQVIYILLNYESLQFSSFSSSMSTCFQIILGKFNSGTFYRSNFILSPWIFVFYNVIIVFSLTNLLVSILAEYFELAQQDQELEREDPELFTYLANYLLFWKSSSVLSENPIYRTHINTMDQKFEKIIRRFKSVSFFVSINKKYLKKSNIIFLKLANSNCQ